MEFTKILKKPNRLSKNQIGYLKSIIDDFPYLQSARAIYLKALKDSNSFKFHNVSFRFIVILYIILYRKSSINSIKKQ